jgi:hypothetical protein
MRQTAGADVEMQTMAFKVKVPLNSRVEVNFTNATVSESFMYMLVSKQLIFLRMPSSGMWRRVNLV